MLDYKRIGLWSHQKDAVKKASEYLDEPNNGKSFLLKLPTGSGKTGIMATITRICYPNKNILIVIPSIALRSQIYDEIKNKFWDKIGFDKSRLDEKKILKLFPSNIDEIKVEIASRPFILICVVNTLHIIKKNNKNDFDYLKEKIDFVIFDEGHREPAYSWANAVRSLKKKILLFTATPFRNDLRLFNIDKDRYYYLTHEEAINQNIIRNIEIKYNPQWSNSGRNLNILLSDVENQIRHFGTPPHRIVAKVIIRCKYEKSIREVVAIMKRKGKRIIGIHENFNNSDDLLNYVPNNDVLDNYDFIAHQNKLIEGIDYPNFLIIIVVDNFGNDRSLIQQIGRVTRNINQTKARKSLVYSANPEHIKEVWDNFINYDNNILNFGKLYDFSDIYKTDHNIKWTYFDGKFKSIAEINNIDSSDVVLPLRTIIRKSKSNIKFSDIIYLIENEISKYDVLPILSKRMDNNGYLILHETFNNSPYLKDNLYIENKFGLIIFYLIDDYFFYYSSDGLIPDHIYKSFNNIEQKKLIQSLKFKNRLTRVNLINSDLGKFNIRSRNLSAFALENTAPSLSDNSHIATFTEAVIIKDKEYYRRYIGLSKSKISDYKSHYVTINEYYDWLLEIYLLLSGRATIKIDYLNRFAQRISPPVNITPINILIDVGEEDIENYKVNGRDSFEFLDTASKIENNTFKLSIIHRNAKKEFECKISFDSSKQKYKIYSDSLAANIFNQTNSDNIVSFLNANQSFRIITENCIAFYAYGSFFSPKLNITDRKDGLDILSIIEQISDLERIKSEKGNGSNLKSLKTIWHKETLFGLISRNGIGYTDERKLKEFFNFEHLVCDDLNDENADFIGINETNQTIALIHAKAKEAKLSASSFHDVCSQVVKNLNYLSPFYEKEPTSNINKWNQPWKNSKIGDIANRIIKGGLSGSEFWDKYLEMLKNPNTRKFVYIATGSMLSKNLLLSELNKPSINDVSPETIQLIYLLRSTWASVSSVGAELKIFSY